MALLALILTQPVFGRKKNEAIWTDRKGRTITRAELDKILLEHRKWVMSEQKLGSPADLSHTDLGLVNLSRATLDGADLSCIPAHKNNSPAQPLIHNAASL